MHNITPFLWFDGKAEEAAKFYTSIFPKSKIRHVTRYGDAGPGPKGSVMTVEFQLDGQTFIALNGGPQFTFNESVSFMVPCNTQAEVDRYWKKLTAGGKEVACGWLKDKYGLCWQIVPTLFFELVSSKDSAKSQRVMHAMMNMVKFDIATLKQVYRGHTKRSKNTKAR